MTQVHLAIGFHCHQPVGNFDWVIENTYRQAYAPLLGALEAHESVPFSLHLSGPLLEWLTAHHPDYLEEVRRLAALGRIELKGGPFFEAILPLIPAEDRAEQLALMAEYLRSRLGAEPEGAWIPERVWEPQLARDLAQAGLRYAVLDDSQFGVAGVGEHEMHSYFATEDQGFRLDLFPISRAMRYLVPFSEPKATHDLLRSILTEDERRRTAGVTADDAPPPLVVCEDDGEKFGAWPDTHDHVYGGWLERFLAMLEEGAAAGWLVPTTLGRYRKLYPATRLVYLGAGSYPEMMGWSGGNFRSFLLRYEEANRLHKRMIGLSRRTLATPAARRHVLRAQCNDAYWHGVFGGLYLPHLRQAVHSELLQAEACLPPPPAHRVFDADYDGVPEVVLRSSQFAALVAPGRGGALCALDHLPTATALLDTLRRRREPEHDELQRRAESPVPPPAGAGAPVGDAEGARGAEGAGGTARPLTIHCSAGSADVDLCRYLIIDPWPRDSLLDHFLVAGFTWEDLHDAKAPEVGSFVAGAYDLVPDPETAAGRPQVTLTWSSTVQGWPVRIHKHIMLAGEKEEDGEVLIGYRIEVLPPQLPQSAARPSEQDVCFAPELNINLLGGDSPMYYVLVDDARPQKSRLGDGDSHPGAHSFTLVDGYRNLQVNLCWRAAAYTGDPAPWSWELPGSGAPGVSRPAPRPATLFRYGVFTVSRSETGFERIFQGTCIMPTWPLRLGRDRALDVQLLIRVTGGPQKPSPR